MCARILIHVCPRTAACVSAYCCMCVLVLLHVSSYCYMCPHTAAYVSIRQHTSAYATYLVSAYYYICIHRKFVGTVTTGGAVKHLIAKCRRP